MKGMMIVEKWKEIGKVTKEGSTSVKAWNIPNFHVEITAICTESPDTESRATNVDLEVGLNERTDCSIYANLQAFGINGNTEEDWEAIKNIRRKIIEVAEQAQNGVKAIMGDKYGKSVYEQGKEHREKEQEK